MSVAQMNKKINIKTIAFGIDSEGFKTQVETVVAQDVRASHDTRKATKKWANLAAFDVVTDTFSFRAIPGLKITSKHYIEFENETYSVYSVNETNGMYVEILATKEDGTIG